MLREILFLTQISVQVSAPFMNKLNFNVAILFLSVAGTYRVPLFCSRSDATFFPFFFERPHSLHVSSMKLESMTEIRKKLKKRSVYM